MAMTDYRVHTVAADGELAGARAFRSDNDDDAIVRAKQWVDGCAVELWNGTRFVARLEPETFPGAASPGT